ncbi:hypothetical protein A0U91_00150 [Acetobacter persici]|uniref:DUF4148 domain-containing protein n=2 Tax=Acetobacter persici TaxID=1076596 RepID=A0A1U9LB90_9PROT|nr:hypothetical protein A0U91_00150 [Acetobacter persici]
MRLALAATGATFSAVLAVPSVTFSPSLATSPPSLMASPSFSTTFADYNWGGGNVRRDQRQNGEDWLSHAPNETQNYVTSISRAVEVAQTIPQGGGGTSAPVNNTTVQVGEIKVSSTSPEQAAAAIQQKILQMGNRASAANSGVS